MEQKRKTRTWCGFLLLLVLLAVFLIWNLFAGSVQLSASQIGQILLGGGDDLTQKQIIMQIRLPRMAAALILGGALSVSGYLLQTFFHNPIAGPFVLGISSGAKLAVSIAMIVFLSRGVSSSSALLIGAAFIGAMLSMGLILLISQRVNQMSLLVVCGVMIGYICSALTDFLVTFADDSNIVNLHNWSNGSFSGMKWENVTTMAWVCGIALILTFFLSKPIRAFQLGEVYARNMGVPIKAFRAALILLSSVLSACVTAFAGPISFVGIALPHLMKALFKTAEPLLLIPASFLGGGIFCLACDLIARMAFAPTEVSISSGTAVFGAPVVLMVCEKVDTAWVRKYDQMGSGDIDTSIVVDQMMMQAEALGLSTCWVCHFDPRVAIDEFGLPADLYPVHMLTVGYAADEIASECVREARTIPMSDFRIVL